MAKKKKTEKKVTTKQPKKDIRLYSLEELSNLFGVSVSQMRSLYSIRGLDKDAKLSYEEAYAKFNNIV